MKKVRSNQVSISVNSCTELSKAQFFPVIIVKANIPHQIETSQLFRKSINPQWDI